MNSLDLDRPPRGQATLRNVRLLVAVYLGISVVTLVVVVLLRDRPAMVTPAVWVRAVIVVCTAALMTAFAWRAARGSSPSYLRLRIASGVMVVAIAVIVVLPGAFPVWLRIEQAVCGVLLLGVVCLVNGRRVRSLFVR